MRFRELLAVLTAAVVSAGVAAAAPVPCVFQASAWGAGVPGGIATTTAPTTTSVSLDYDVNLGNPGPGVSNRSATFVTSPDADGVITFDWSFTGFHSFSLARAGCTITSDLASGSVNQALVASQSVSGNFAFSGSVSIMVQAGRTVTVTISGQNNDSNSRMMGSLVVSNVALHTSFANAADPYRAGAWASTGIAGGTTNIAASGTPAGASGVFSYAVNLGNPGSGVGYRSTEYYAIATGCGPVSFNWNWNAFHSFFQAAGDLHAFADGPHGRTIVDLATGGGGGFNLSGTATVNATLGYRFGLLVGGSNFDSNSQITGTVTLTNFSAPRSFDGAYQGQYWSALPMPGGTASRTPFCGPTDTVRMNYSVALGNPGPGVTARTAALLTQADQTGVASMDWDFAGNHAFSQANATLVAFADTATGRVTVPLVNQTVAGAFTTRGCVRLNVESGRFFGFIVTGSNFDSNSFLAGNVILSNFCIGPTAPCIADYNHSGVVSVQDIFDFLAAYFANERHADVNCSGAISVQDIFDFLAAYFGGC